MCHARDDSPEDPLPQLEFAERLDQRGDKRAEG